MAKKRKISILDIMSLSQNREELTFADDPHFFAFLNHKELQTVSHFNVSLSCTGEGVRYELKDCLEGNHRPCALLQNRRRRIWDLIFAVDLY